METSETFDFDVFLSHSSKDKAVVREIAERLRKDGLRIWFDEWILKPGDSIPARIEEGLECSRVLVLCMSAHAFGSAWAQLESQTFRFRDPLNKERRFIPLRLDSTPVKGSLSQFLHIDWSQRGRGGEFLKLRDACGFSTSSEVGAEESTRSQKVDEVATIHYLEGGVRCWSFSPDGTLALTGTEEGTVGLWNLESGHCMRMLYGHAKDVVSLDWNLHRGIAASGSRDGAWRLWNINTGQCLHVFEENVVGVRAIAISNDGRHALTGDALADVQLWDIGSCQFVRTFRGHLDVINDVIFGAQKNIAISAADDHTARLWSLETGECLQIFKGHSGPVNCVRLSADQRNLLSASSDRTLRLWELATGRCLRVMEGHRDEVRTLEWGRHPYFALSSSDDQTIRLWDMEKGRCRSVLAFHHGIIHRVGWSEGGRRVISGDSRGTVQSWDLSEIVGAREGKLAGALELEVPWQVQYANAKVLLVGESGVGKTGLSSRLASNQWELSDSTVGAWATQWKLPVAPDGGIEREIWLWDFGGQADQRLIHQLYMDETALAVLVFDGQKEDLFESLGQWDRDLSRAARSPFTKLLVAGRVDAGGLRVSRKEVEKFARDRNFRGFLETSAKTNLGCDELKAAIEAAINWDEIPCRTTEILFRQLKEEILRLKDEGRVLMRFNELRETLRLRTSGQLQRFADEELRAVLTLLAGPGVVWELTFGSWVLLQPERINAYAQSVIRTLQADEQQRGCLLEERVLNGDLTYDSSLERLEDDEERFVLLAMHQTLVEHGLCLRQPTAKGNLLVFPSYYRRERPEQIRFPAVLVNYRFTGFLDEIYATLVVRLHHSEPFQPDRLWHYSADFTTSTGKRLGIKLTRRAPGQGELEVYFDPDIVIEEKITFSKYVHEHLLQQAREVERLRHYVCKCGTSVGNREIAMQRLNDWLRGRPVQADGARLFNIRKAKDEPSIICVGCEKRVPLWDEMEQSFASPEIQQRVRDMQEESKIILDNESKERALVGEVVSTVALAAQISRELSVSDHGIDMEIEFKDDTPQPTGQKVYLQLKSGDSYLRKRKNDGAEIFTIKDERHACYWMAQPFPVLLVIRDSEGEVRWMEVRDWLKRESEDGKKPVNQIVFEGERFDVMSVRRWRERVLTGYSVSRGRSTIIWPTGK